MVCTLRNVRHIIFHILHVLLNQRVCRVDNYSKPYVYFSLSFLFWLRFFFFSFIKIQSPYVWIHNIRRKKNENVHRLIFWFVLNLICLNASVIGRRNSQKKKKKYNKIIHQEMYNCIGDVRLYIFVLHYSFFFFCTYISSGKFEAVGHRYKYANTLFSLNICFYFLAVCVVSFAHCTLPTVSIRCRTFYYCMIFNKWIGTFHIKF